MRSERQGILAAMGTRKRAEVVLRVAIVVAAALAVVACAQPVDPPPSVVLIVLDTVRADHMGLYGYERDTTPRLAEWAQRGTVFDNAFSTAAWTLPGVGSLLTGLYPSQHGAGISGPRRMHDDVPTMAEVLSAAGYDTGAVANVGFLSPVFGLNRGFVDYDLETGGDQGGRRADASVDWALNWLSERSDRPSLLLLHLFDAHRFYDAPPPARGVFTSEYAADYDPATLATLDSRVEAERRGDMDFHVAAYDEEILWLDMQVDRFLNELRENGLFDDTLVILTADHGEAFREHGAIAHGSSLHNEVIRVPLIVWAPGQTEGQRLAAPVSLVDIFPTVTEYAGLPAIETSGLSLRGALRGEEVAPRAIFAQNRFYRTDLTTLIRWPLKLIQDHKNQLRMLYDLQLDPGETENLWDRDDPDVVRLVNAMRREVRAIRQGREGSEVEMSEELAERLRALGYIQ